MRKNLVNQSSLTYISNCTTVQHWKRKLVRGAKQGICWKYFAKNQVRSISLDRWSEMPAQELYVSPVLIYTWLQTRKRVLDTFRIFVSVKFVFLRLLFPKKWSYHTLQQTAACFYFFCCLFFLLPLLEHLFRWFFSSVALLYTIWSVGLGGGSGKSSCNFSLTDVSIISGASPWKGNSAMLQSCRKREFKKFNLLRLCLPVPSTKNPSILFSSCDFDEKGDCSVWFIPHPCFCHVCFSTMAWSFTIAWVLILGHSPSTFNNYSLARWIVVPNQNTKQSPSSMDLLNKTNQYSHFPWTLKHSQCPNHITKYNKNVTKKTKKILFLVGKKRFI